jgi:hypothetical protein
MAPESFWKYMTDYDVWSVQKLFELELEEVRKLYEETLDPEMATMLEQVIKYLEMRLDGRIQ